MTPPFAFAATYAFGLSLLILSHWIGWGLLDLFLRRPYELGTHTLAWMNWMGASCAFVGLVNVVAARWRDARARRDAALATAAIFGVWAAQNFWLMMGDRFTPLMWSNVVGCLIAATWSLLWARRQPAAKA